jgi:uncharacterized protein YdaU (DUF1376 family)
LNYYEHHIGDYAKDAGHLSMAEDGAYRRLLDAYYSREQTLPADVRGCCKLARATTKAERDAVAYVLSEFFDLRDDGHHQKRCDEEIERYLETEPEREQKRENARERQRRARERRKALFEDLRTHGITPAWDASTHALESMLSRVTRHGQSQPVTRDNTATHTQSPDTKHQEQLSEHALTPQLDAPPTPAVRACLLIRQRGCTTANPHHPELLAACAEGVSPEAIDATYAEGVAAGKSKPFAWAIATARSRHATGAQPIAGDPHANRSPSRRESVAERAERFAREGDDSEARRAS